MVAFWLSLSIFHSTGFFSTGFLSIGIASAQEQEARVWKSKDGKHVLEAKFVSFDEATNLVKLESMYGETFEIALNQLRSSDRKYVAKFQSQSKTTAKTTANPFRKSKTSPNSNARPNKPKPKSATTRTPDANRKKNDNKNSRNLYGITWTGPLQNALKLAKGKQTSKDDRPIMWFRVLGQLEGFM